MLHLAGANAMAISLQRGQRVTLSKVDAFADGVAVKQVGAETFRLCQQLVDGVLLVDNRAISAAIKDVFNETRSILEPAGAVAVAGAKAYLKQHQIKVGPAYVKMLGALLLHTTVLPSRREPQGVGVKRGLRVGSLIALLVACICIQEASCRVA